ncbi:MAG: hypothetical protein CMJ18_14230 [Phycisphaeraceae bacterium]|nr:hypothetical protein [Phycisphaeraceae bacterium]
MGVASWAAPVLAPIADLSSSVRSVAKIETIRVLVNPLSVTIPGVRFSPKNVAEATARRFRRHGYKIVTSTDAPRLVLSNICLPHDDSTTKYSYTLYVTLEQPVEIPRLKHEMTVPTYINLTAGMDESERLGTRIGLGFRELVMKFIEDAQKATSRY